MTFSQQFIDVFNKEFLSAHHVPGNTSRAGKHFLLRYLQ